MQAFVITALNVVIAVLVALIVWAPFGSSSAFGEGGGDGGGGSPTGGEVKHEKLRAAIDGAVPEVVRETRLMGYGDETVVSVFFRDGVSYIFGNATVKGLDFDNYGGFLCIVNAAGSIMSFTYFDGAIGAVSPVGGGYAVGAGEELYFVDYLGKAEKASELDGAALDIFPAPEPDKIAVVTQPSDSEIRLVEYKIKNESFTAGNRSRVYSLRTLEYFACYGYGGEYVIAARAVSSTQDSSLAFFSFVAGETPTAHYDVDAVNTTTPFAVMPREDGGYIVLCGKNGSASIVKLGAAFSAFPATELEFETSGARLFFDGKKYYANFYKEDGAVTYEITDDDAARSRALDGVKIDCVINAAGVAIAGRKSETQAVVARASGEELELGMDDVKIYGGFKNGEYTTLVLSAVGGEALSKPTAGRDIYVVTVRI